MNCSRCGTQMEMQTVSQTKHRNPLVILIYIVLLFIPIIGWIALAVCNISITLYLFWWNVESRKRIKEAEKSQERLQKS